MNCPRGHGKMIFEPGCRVFNSYWHCIYCGEFFEEGIIIRQPTEEDNPKKGAKRWERREEGIV